MANNLILTTPNYTQAEKNFFITDAVIALDSLNANLFYIASDVHNDQYTFPKVQSTIVLQDRASIPTASGSTTLSNKDCVLGSFMGYAEFEPTVFENHWQQADISSKLLMRGLPVTFENYLSSNYTSQVLANVENLIWKGSKTYTGATNNLRFVDGIIKQCLTPATSANTSINTGLTSANIIAEMEKVKQLTPRALLSRADRYTKLRFVMSVEDGQKYEDALTTTTFKNNDTTERGLNKYKGYEVVVVAGMPENTFFFGWADASVQSNLHMPISSIENMQFDLNRLQNNSTLWFYKMLFKFGVGVAKPYEMQMSTNLTLAFFTGA
jgi:hypothetical protein